MLNTIPGFTDLTRQQMFDAAIAHVGTTREKSKRGTGCVYGGIGCAASVFLTEDARRLADSLPDSSWDTLALTKRVPAHEYDFVTALQLCHDAASENNGRFMFNWTANMRTLGLEKGLKLDKLIEVEYSLE